MPKEKGLLKREVIILLSMASVIFLQIFFAVLSSRQFPQKRDRIDSALPTKVFIDGKKILFIPGQTIKKTLGKGRKWEQRILYSQEALRFCLDENEEF